MMHPSSAPRNPMTGSLLLTALYLKGGPRCCLSYLRNWPKIRRLLELSPSSLESFSKLLERHHFHQEAQILSATEVMRWAEKVLKSGEVLTYFCSSYPKAWKHKLKHSAPPALWSKGAPPPPKETLAIVGSRNIDEEAQRFAYQCAYHAVQKGFTVCSGAAIGTDSWAAYGAVEATKQEDCPTPLIEILPYGVRHIKKHYPAYRLSTCAPSATFSSQQAMERNTLIYASARLAVVVQPRWRQGGSWHGALNALQRRLTAVTIFGDPTDPGTSELLAKGASLIHHPPEIEVLLKNLSHQPPLFEAP